MRILATMAALAVAACSSTAAVEEKEMKNIHQSAWGTWEGKPVSLFTLKNRDGLVAKITNYGTILTEMHVPGRDGKMADVALGYDTLAPYLLRHPYFGCTAGRVANRIAGGKFTLDGKAYTLAVNNGPNHLHGGKVGFDQKIWDAEPAPSEEGPGVKLTYVSPDGEEGYPGTLTTTVTYTLTHDNELKVAMRATTDRTTIVNLAHHTYWNLAGHGSGDVLGHEMAIYADRYTPTDATLIPTGKLAPVAGTPFDFRTAKKIGKDIGVLKAETGAAHGGGYDLNFVVNGKGSDLRPVAVVSDPASGRVMEISADQPGVQLYTGNGLSGAGKGGATYKQYSGFCLETQKFPDSINKPDFPTVVLKPGETYRHTMIHRFRTK